MVPLNVCYERQHDKATGPGHTPVKPEVDKS